MSWANQYVGVPYVSNGRGMDGFDCWGLIVLAYKHHRGIELPSYGVIDARRLLDVAHALYEGRVMGPWERVATPAPFDVVGMFGRVEGSRRVVHVGLVVDSQRLIHAQQKTHCAVERFDSPLIRNRIDAFWRYTDA